MYQLYQIQGSFFVGLYIRYVISKTINRKRPCTCYSRVYILILRSLFNCMCYLVVYSQYNTCICGMKLLVHSPRFFFKTFCFPIYFQYNSFIISSLFPLFNMFVSIYSYNLMVTTACLCRPSTVVTYYPQVSCPFNCCCQTFCPM